jgi:hypothetical protein
MSHRALAIVLAIVACALGAVGVGVAVREPAPRTAIPSAPAAVDLAPPASSSVVAGVAANATVKVAPAASSANVAPAASVPQPSTTFDQAMASPDAFVRRAAIDRAVQQGDTSVLARLQAVDLTVDGYEAAAAIAGVGKLTALLPEAERKAPVATLAKWLAQESRREAPGAMGNAITAIESLGETRSREAVGPLVLALDGERLPLNVETTIVQTLVELDAREAAPSVARFHARTSKRVGADDLERALIAEGLAAAQAALAKWK